ncbi:MAG: formate dehydrogenase accessory sulfurtransferase FdhD [Actinomycetia bacterium]|nr:formate dehydrogenase accessory sulfurtransferase FdhD [Actinomycetes bacterium]
MGEHAGSDASVTPADLRGERPAWTLRADGTLEPTSRPAAVERPFTLYVNGRELVTIVASPSHLLELALGYLANEGLIARADEVTTRVVDPEAGQIWLHVPGRTISGVELGRRWLTACCGRARATLYFANDADLAPVGPGVRLDPAAIFARMADLEDGPPALRQTGGLHWAGVGDGKRLWVRRADVGRHNALDKVAGWCLLTGRSPAGYAVVFSGRVSSEVVVKAARMGAAWILSNAAPTSLALELADTLNLTVVGFVRDGRATVYTHPERLGVPLPTTLPPPCPPDGPYERGISWRP